MCDIPRIGKLKCRQSRVGAAIYSWTSSVDFELLRLALRKSCEKERAYTFRAGTRFKPSNEQGDQSGIHVYNQQDNAIARKPIWFDVPPLEQKAG